MKNHLNLGNWNVVCDVCGFKFKASDTKKRWDGLIVCPQDYELRHQSDFLRVRKERISVPFTRPEPMEVTEVFVAVCTIQTSSPLAGFGTAGCATVGGNTSTGTIVSVNKVPLIADIGIPDISIAGVF